MGARAEDLADLGDRELELGLGVEEMGTQAKPDVRTEVAEDLPLGELLVHALRSRERGR